MTREELIKDFLQYWKDKGTKLPDPDQYPKQFKWFIDQYNFYKNYKRE